jgi:hypothetical protein
VINNGGGCRLIQNQVREHGDVAMADRTVSTNTSMLNVFCKQAKARGRHFSRACAAPLMDMIGMCGRAARISDASSVSPMPGIMTSVTTAEYSCDMAVQCNIRRIRDVDVDLGQQAPKKFAHEFQNRRIVIDDQQRVFAHSTTTTVPDS